MASRIVVRQVRSAIGSSQKIRRVLRALGLRRVGQEREKPDNPAVRGMIDKVQHLVEVRES
jgi:large subunit ribosomal protein L30